MNRRAFLQRGAALGAMSLAGSRPSRAFALTPNAQGAADTAVTPSGKANAAAKTAEAEKAQRTWRGVNLGSWLVLEKWIAPNVFADTTAADEYTLCQALGRDKAADRLKRHRETWITEEDFAWLAARGLNAVRLPMGYWILEDNPPFVSGRETLDWAFRTARKNGLSVLLDLHGAPGSQNGWDHSGRAGDLGWHTSRENIAHTLRVVEDLAAHCKAYDNFLGLELLNEPRWDVPLPILKTYYQDAYARVRKHVSAERTAVVIHDGFRPTEWTNFMQPPVYSNALLDTHLYQCYTDEDRKRDIFAHVEIAGLERKRQLDMMQRQMRGIVGE